MTRSTRAVTRSTTFGSQPPSDGKARCVDPAHQEVEPIFQRLEATARRDNLTGEDLTAEESRVRQAVPLGIFRIPDITHRP